MIFLTASALAATLHVDPADPTAYASIGAALGAAAAADEVLVAPGTYHECLSISGWTVSIRGAEGSGSTFLEPEPGCAAAVYAWGGNVVVDGFTVRNPGGRAFQFHWAYVALDDIVVEGTGNEGWQGGAAYLEGVPVTISHSRFTDNVAYEGGALYLYAWNDVDIVASEFEANSATTGWGGAIGAYYDNSLSVSGSSFTGNSTVSSGGAIAHAWYSDFSVDTTSFTANVAGGSGGAIMLYANDINLWMTLADVTFEGNEATTGSGGAIEAEWYNNLEVTRGVFTGNTAAGHGGAVSGWYYQSASFSGSTFTGNTSSGAYGGAVFWYPTDTSAYDLSITDSAFTDNAAPLGPGGALWAGSVRDTRLVDTRFDHNAASWAGGAVEVYVGETLELDGSRFCGNLATGAGGGLSAAWLTRDTWTNTVFLGNTADYGGGAYRYSVSSATTRNNTFVANQATSYGGGYYAEWAPGDLVNNAFAWNTGGSGAYAGESSTPTASLVAWDAWYANSPADAGGYYWVDPDAGHLQAVDPGFAAWSGTPDCAATDLHLAATSPLRDAGDPALTDLDGSRSDIGAWGRPGAPVEDHDGDGVDSTSDCADADPSTHPGAEEVCGGGDEDCDGTVDEADAAGSTAWYTDADGDGWGSDPSVGDACVAPDGAVAQGGDCDDADPGSAPGAEEVAGDGVDQDCSGADLPAADHDTGSHDTGEADPPKGSGCGCSTGAPGTGPWPLLALLPLARRRRTGPPSPPPGPL